VVSSSGGVKDSWASARPRTKAIEVSSRRFEIHVYDPSARSWKFPVSKMKHYLTWWANSIQSRCNTLRALGMLRDRPADHEKAVREAVGAVDGGARVLLAAERRPAEVGVLAAEPRPAEVGVLAAERRSVEGSALTAERRPAEGSVLAAKPRPAEVEVFEEHAGEVESCCDQLFSALSCRCAQMTLTMVWRTSRSFWRNRWVNCSSWA
jgi:hypothetical protein